jgi:hypothetical protein
MVIDRHWWSLVVTCGHLVSFVVISGHLENVKMAKLIINLMTAKLNDNK